MASTSSTSRTSTRRIEWAAKIPGAQFGSVEIRPVMVFDEAGNIVEEATAQ